MAADDLLFETPAPASPAMVFGASEPAAPLAPGDLRFAAVAPASPNLCFGAEGADTSLPTVDAVLAGTLPLPVLLAEGRVAIPALLTGTLPGMTLQASLRSPGLVDLSATLPLPKLSAMAVARVDAVLTGVLPGPALLAEVTAPVNASLTGTLASPTFAARTQTAQPGVKLVFSSDPVTDGNLLFGPEIETQSATLTGVLPAPAFAASIGPQQQIVRLRFAVEASSSTRLVFGRDGEAPVKVESAALAGILPAPTLQVQTRSIATARLTGALPLPQVLAEARYFSNTSRPTVGQRLTLWSPTNLADQTGLAQRQQVGLKAPVSWQPAWQQGLTHQPGVDHPLPKVLVRDHVPSASGFQVTQPLPDLTTFRHQEAARSVRVLLADAFEQAAELRDATGFRHQVADRTQRGWMQGEWENPIGMLRAWHTDFQPAKAWVFRMGGRYQEAVPPQPGISVLVVPKPPGPVPCYTPDPPLLFSQAFGATPHLVFVCQCQRPDFVGTVVVPVRRVYFVINNVSLHRIADGLEVPVYSLSLSLDASSWTWGFEARLPVQAEALVASSQASEPVKLAARVNGTLFCVYAEHISRERTFGEASIRVSGRGRNAVLGAPYAPVMTFRNGDLRSARQLMEDVLTVNGVPLGWTIDWGLTDWNVPTGVFSLQGTWIEALTTIATAAGAYLLPHPAGQSIRVRHRYPVPPWEWASVTPDVVLPVEAVSRESLRWLKKPAYNRVFVSGQEVGVLGQVTRAGTAGNILAPMVVDPLITEVAAARQRGLAVLADTGSQLEVSLRLPVLAETGIIQPGAFVEYRDGSVTRLGLVRSTQIDAGLPEVWQTLGVQSHA